MKTIATLEGAEFLKRCNALRHSAEKLLRETKVLELRKVRPILTGEETEAERKAKVEEQAKKNINAMFDKLLDEYPELTYDFLKLCIVDEKKPDGMDLLLAAVEIINSKKVMDFLSRLMLLAQKNMGD